MFAAHAVVHSSSTKLRSVIATGDEATTGCDPLLLQGMLDSLVAIEPLLEDAEKRCVMMEHECISRDLPSKWWPAEGLAMEFWLKSVTNNAYKISDWLDMWQDTRKTAPSAARKTRMFPRGDNVPEKKTSMAHNLEEMKDELSKLVDESAQFKLGPFYRGSVVEPIITDAPIDDEAILLAREEEIKRIISASYSCEEGPIIVKIVGEDGSGKTSIARFVFNHSRFKQYAHVWIYVGRQGFNMHQIAKSIISQASGEKERSYHSWDENMDSVTKRLGELLDNGMKLLLVLDDAYLSGEYCIQLKRMLSVSANKDDTKVMVMATARYLDAPGSFNVSLEPLSCDDCWTIIKQRSGFEERSDRQELESIGREIANRCHGIPFEAAVLGAILRYKDATGWAAIALDSSPREPHVYGPHFLDLACTSMPPSLMLCFAYFSILPVGQPVAKHDLIHQWMALRLLEPSGKFSAKQLGEHHIRMLQGMSILQTTKSSDKTRGRDDKGVIMITPHPVVQEHAELHLRGFSTHEKYKETDLLVTYRSSFMLPSGPDQIRAVRFVGCSKMELTDDAFSSLTWLRVLELKEHWMQKLPGSICQLRHLGYLNLSGCSRLEILPESFGDLLHLFHMDLSGCSRLVTLPESFGKLINIMHIDLSGCSKLEKLPESIVKAIKLVHIDLAGCSALLRLPELLWKLTDLEHINLSGCSALVNLPGSFGKLINLVYINLSSCSRLVKLPQSFGKLVNLPHLNLSGCFGLTKLPRSLCKLKNVQHVNLSGCSRLIRLPESIGKLTKLVHIDLSGCSGLITLPESVGDLTELLHINLSRCYGLSILPESFKNLEKLQHLDLSFWSCFGVIRTALVGRRNLQHLNLSDPCCSLAKNQPDLQGLKEVAVQLSSLQYLNLSRFLNPMLDSQSDDKTQVVLKEKEKEIDGYIEFISGLSSLEHLDLSHNIYLRDVPECLGGLTNLHTLDLSGCIRLKSIAKRIGEMKSIKSLNVRNCRSLKSYQLVVQAVDDGVAYSNLVQLRNADFEELEISRLENAKSLEDSHRVGLAAKRRLEKLKLCWTSESTPQRFVEDNALLREMGLPQSLQFLELRGYSDKIYPAVWWKNNLINLTEVTLEDFLMCSQLPPLGLLPNLQRVVLRRMASIRRIDGGDMSFHNRPASKPLLSVKIEHMDNLEQFNTTYYGSADGGEELMFPAMNELWIQNCPNLCFQPLPPRASWFNLVKCGHAMAAWSPTEGGPRIEGPPVDDLVVQKCECQLDKWSFLYSLPGLRSLIIDDCPRLTSSPEIIQALSSLQSLQLYDCTSMKTLPEHLGDLASLRKLKIVKFRSLKCFPDSMRKLTLLESMDLSKCYYLILPPWLGDLTSLRELGFDSCRSVTALPDSIGKLTNLKYVHISDCKTLTRWCDTEEGKITLAHIQPKYEKLGSTQPGTQSPPQHSSQRPNGPGLQQPPLQDSAAWLPQQYQAFSQPPWQNTHWQAPQWQGPPPDFSASSSQQHQSYPQPHLQTTQWQGAPQAPAGFQWRQPWHTTPWNGTTGALAASRPQQHQSMPQSSWQSIPWQGASQDFAVAPPQQHQGVPQSSWQSAPSQGAPQTFVDPLQQQHQSFPQPHGQTTPWQQHPQISQPSWNGTTAAFAASRSQLSAVSAPQQQQSMPQSSWQGSFTVAPPQQHQPSWQSAMSQGGSQTFVDPQQQRQQQSFLQPHLQTTQWRGAAHASVGFQWQQQQEISQPSWNGTTGVLAASPPHQYPLSAVSAPQQHQSIPWQGGSQVFAVAPTQQPQTMSQTSWQSAPPQGAPQTFVAPLQQQQHQGVNSPSWHAAPQGFSASLPQQHQEVFQPSCQNTSWQGAPQPQPQALVDPLPHQHSAFLQTAPPQAFSASLPQQHQVMSQPPCQTAPCESAPNVIRAPLPEEHNKMPQPPCHTALQRRKSW